MQPYAFPYIGYFCLCQASDIFVFLDDVNFIQKGWINRNQILINGRPYRFTIPLEHASQNELICKTTTHSFDTFKVKFIKQIEQAYKKSVFYQSGLEYVNRVLSKDSVCIADLAINSIIEAFDILDIKKSFFRSSTSFPDTRHLLKEDRLIQITKNLNSDRYLNAIGGLALYDRGYFLERSIELSFIKPHLSEYKQPGTAEFIGNLSIIDIFMNNHPDDIRSMLDYYDVVTPSGEE